MMEVNLYGKNGTDGEHGTGAAGRAPVFSCRQDKRTPQVELQRALEELYETYVPAETRAYLDAKCRPNRPRPRRTAAKTARQQSAEPLDGSGSAQ